jgi:hypothetical protein
VQTFGFRLTSPWLCTLSTHVSSRVVLCEEGRDSSGLSLVRDTLVVVGCPFGYSSTFGKFTFLEVHFFGGSLF